MKFHLTAKTFDHITGENEIAKLRQQNGNQIKQVKESGKLIDGGVFLEKRAAFMILECDSENELFDLISPVQDHCHVELHPLVSFEKLQEYFERDMAKQESLN